MNRYLVRKGLLNPANVITFIRIAILFGVVTVFEYGGIWANYYAAVLCTIVFLMDRLDGFLANRLNCKTDFGGVIDVAGDRIIENVLWLLFFSKGLFPIWMPIFVITRGFIIDSFRGFALSQGFSTFAMMKQGFGWQLVASPASRFIYAGLKMALFIIAFFITDQKETLSNYWLYSFQLAAGIIVLVCLVRGWFTVKEILPLFENNSTTFEGIDTVHSENAL